MDYGIFNVRTDLNTCDCTQGYTDTVRKSALKFDSGRKILCRTCVGNVPVCCPTKWATFPPRVTSPTTAETLVASVFPIDGLFYNTFGGRGVLPICFCLLSDFIIVDLVLLCICACRYACCFLWHKPLHLSLQKVFTSVFLIENLHGEVVTSHLTLRYIKKKKMLKVACVSKCSVLLQYCAENRKKPKACVSAASRGQPRGQRTEEALHTVSG